MDGLAANPVPAALPLATRVPIAFARRFGLLPTGERDGYVEVAIASPDALPMLDKLVPLLGRPVMPVYVPPDELHRMIDEAYGRQETGVERAVDELRVESGSPRDDAAALLAEIAAGGDLLDSDAAAPVTRLVNLVLLEAVKRRASDVHVQPYEGRIVIRLRIDGVLYDFVEPPRRLLDEVVSRIKVMGRMNIAEKRLAQDGRATVRVGEKTVDLRISTLPTSHGERVVIRLLDKSARLYRLAELGMGERDLVVFRRLIRATHGIVLVTGPTGSGKTTTLYAALAEVSSRELNVLTLEDPIEYQLPGISQTQVSDKKGMTFATGLRHVLRQDPDVIMVGEIRDEATARMAVQSSLTGHLVFSTLHTNNAAGAVARLIDLGVEPYLVAGSLLGVLAQRLVRMVCEQCRQPHEFSRAEAGSLDCAQEFIGRSIFRAIGCEACHQTGYRDRAGIFELLEVNEELHDLIAASPRSRAIKQAARRAGMRTLREDAVERMLMGRTTIEEVLRVTHVDEELSEEKPKA